MNPTCRILRLALLAGALTAHAASTPPGQRLLPPDTLAFLSLPDYSAYRVAQHNSAGWRLWNDSALRPFREKFLNKLQAEVLDKLEREAGLKLKDYAKLLQGQLSLAITRNGWKGTADPVPGLVIILDTRDRGDALEAQLAEIRKKIADAGHTLKTEPIRDVEFSTLALQPPAPEAPVLNLKFGRVGPVLVAGTVTRDLERVVAGLQGKSLPNLSEETSFSEDFQAFFREAQVFGWIHFSPLAEIVTQLAASAGGDNPVAPKPDALLNALGLKGLKTLAFALRDSPEGGFLDLHLRAPWAERKGLLQLLATEPKDAGIPAFVPADAVSFWRWRLDGQKFWASLESLANEISPGMLGFFTAQLDAALKERDPNFDFRRSFLMNLGDDFMGYQKPPRSSTPADLLAQPALTLIGSPNAAQLLSTLRTALTLLPGQLAQMEMKERDFLGQRIYCLTIPDLTGSGQVGQFHLTASGGYLAFSDDAAILEEYLRRAENRPKPLAELPGLREAAERAGGAGYGLFGFQNDAEVTRPYWEALRSNKNLLVDLVTAQNPVLKDSREDADQFTRQLAEWLDFSLLPPFDQVAHYFHISVLSGRASSTGYALRFFSPTPPKLR